MDIGVLYADHDTDTSRHDAAADSLECVYNGELGQPYVSEYVYDEAVTLTFRRSNSFEAAADLGKRIRGESPFPAVHDLLYVSPAAFDDAVEIFEQFDDQTLSFTDAVQVAQMERRDIDILLSFDDDFDGLVDRLAPADVR